MKQNQGLQKLKVYTSFLIYLDENNGFALCAQTMQLFKRKVEPHSGALDVTVASIPFASANYNIIGGLYKGERRENSGW